MIEKSNDDIKKSGSLTVFFTLVCMLIFALIGTTIEVARYKVCQVHSYRTLKMAEESLFTEYSKPLFEQYKLLFLEEGKGFETSIMEYASPTLAKGLTDLFDGTMTGIETKEVVYIGDEGAMPLKNEIKDYMMRKLPKDIFDKYIKKAKSFDDIEKKSKEMEERVKKEEEEAKDNINMLELMCLVDGVKIGGNEKVKGEQVFAKMFLKGEKKAQAVGINHPIVWDRIKGNIISIEEAIQGDESLFLGQAKDCLKVTKKAISVAGKMANNVKNVLKGNQKVLEDTISLLEKGKNETTNESLTLLWKAYDTTSITFDYTGLSEQGGADNPGDKISEALDAGILNLVLQKPDKMSKCKVENSDIFCKLYKEESKVKKTNALADTTNYVYDEFCIDQYIDTFCKSVLEAKDGAKRLQYESEYVVSGKETDVDNLEAIVNRLLLIRTVTNFGSLWASNTHRNEAYAAAVAIVGFTGMEPLIRLTQTLLMITWATVESMVDIAAMIQEAKVPIIKTKKELMVTFKELFGVNHKFIQYKAKRLTEKQSKGLSMGYEDYMTMFMIGMNQSVKLYRLMDLIQWNMEIKRGGKFRLASMIYSLRVKGFFQFQTKFFRFPVIENILKRKLYQFNAALEVSNTY